MNQYELPIIPKAGEVFLYIDLNALGDMPVAKALEILNEMGHTPELRYRQSKADGHISVYALLKHEQHEPERFLDDAFRHSYLENELDALAERIPTDAIHSPRGLGRSKVLAA